jgi:hypothetical protein
MEQKTPNLKNLPEVQPPTQTVLPTLNELFDESLELAGKQEGLNAILNTPPPDKWIKEHPHIPGWKYLPIDKVEYLLTKIFKRTNIEVRKTGMLMNAVEVTVRVHYFNPAVNEMCYHDGVGACELQTQAKSGALKMDMSNVNRGAVSMALPIAKTLAVKDATDHIGKIFGRDLNRKDVLPFEPDMKLISRYDTLLETPANGKH